MRNKYSTFNQKRYERFVHTLEECGTFLINADDDTIERCIFEDFDIDVRCFLCDSELEFFFGLISSIKFCLFVRLFLVL